MRLLVASALLFTGCFGMHCRTKCGMVLTNSYWSCEEFQEIEDKVLSEYRKHSSDPRTHMCERLDGWVVFQDNNRTFQWSGDRKREVRGETFCPEKVMHINYESTRRSSLAHEMGHALQDCIPAGPLNDADPAHSNWERDGLNDAWRTVEIWEQFP